MQYKSGKNKGYYYSYCKLCCNTYTAKHKISHPWMKIYKHALSRCNHKNTYYYRKGIIFNITPTEMKKLWFRDKAHLMKQPNIHRIDNTKGYLYENCQFLERKSHMQKHGKVLNERPHKRNI